MPLALRVAPPPPTAETSGAFLRLLDRWRGQLAQRHFTPWRIDHDLQAVAACLRDLGPPANWEGAALRARYPRRRSGRVRDDTPLAEIAVRRFQAFCAHPAETELETQILGAWWNQLTVSGRNGETREKYRDAVLRFGDGVGPLWRATARSFETYGAARVRAGVARETLRGDQMAVRGLERFINGDDEWTAQILALTGSGMRPICTPSNTLAHLHTCPEGQVGRSFTNRELRVFFGHLQARIEAAAQRRRKGRWTAGRDFALFSTMLASGGRDSCLARVREPDLPPAYGETAAYSRFEEIHFFGKADPGGTPKPRIVPAFALFEAQWAALDWYLREVRPHLAGAQSGDAIFLSERGRPLSANDISRIFREHRDAAGLPDDLHAHGLRHTFAQRLRQDGVDLAIIQILMGHNAESTTMRYAKLTPAFIKDRQLECARRQRRESDACAR